MLYFDKFATPPTRLRPQQLVADVMTAVRNKHQFQFQCLQQRSEVLRT